MGKKLSVGAGQIISGLTPRQIEVLDLLAKGKSYKQIACDLNVGMETVRQHIKDIYRRLGVNSRTQALLKYLDL